MTSSLTFPVNYLKNSLSLAVIAEEFGSYSTF